MSSIAFPRDPWIRVCRRLTRVPALRPESAATHLRAWFPILGGHAGSDMLSHPGAAFRRASVPGSTLAIAQEPLPKMTDRTEPDWANVRNDLRRFILHRLQSRFRSSVNDHDLENCVQDGLVRLYRWWCRERDAQRPIGNLDAMMNRVANFSAVDFIRDQVKRRRLEPIGPAEPHESGGPRENIDLARLAQEPAPAFVDAPERLKFLLLAHFDRAYAPCAETARKFFANLGWQAVATDMGLNVDTVKQRWSRCVKAFREFLAEHPECEAWIFEEYS